MTDFRELDLTKLVSYDVEVELDDCVYEAQLHLVDIGDGYNYDRSVYPIIH